MLQTDMRRLAKYTHSQGNCTTIRIPHDTTRRFRQEHSYRVAPKQSFSYKPGCAIHSTCFFIGNQHQSNFAIQIHFELFQSTNCKKHRYDSALHVGRAAPKQEVLFPKRLKLCRGLRWNNVVMPVKVKGSLSAAMGREETLGGISGVIFRNARPQTLTIKTRLPQVDFQKIHTGAIVVAWRILRWDSNKVRRDRRHLVFALPQPRKNRTALRC